MPTSSFAVFVLPVIKFGNDEGLLHFVPLVVGEIQWPLTVVDMTVTPNRKNCLRSCSMQSVLKTETSLQWLQFGLISHLPSRRWHSQFIGLPDGIYLLQSSVAFFNSWQSPASWSPKAPWPSSALINRIAVVLLLLIATKVHYHYSLSNALLVMEEMPLHDMIAWAKVALAIKNTADVR